MIFVSIMPVRICVWQCFFTKLMIAWHKPDLTGLRALYLIMSIFPLNETQNKFIHVTWSLQNMDDITFQRFWLAHNINYTGELHEFWNVHKQHTSIPIIYSVIHVYFDESNISTVYGSAWMLDFWNFRNHFLTCARE